MSATVTQRTVSARCTACGSEYTSGYEMELSADRLYRIERWAIGDNRYTFLPPCPCGEGETSDVSVDGSWTRSLT